jgi:hypothetical protein
LTHEATVGVLQLYIWNHGTIQLVGIVGTGPISPVPGVALSENGRFAEIVTGGPLAGASRPSGACPATQVDPEGFCEEAYAYDITDGTLECMSCSSITGPLGDAGIGLHEDSANPRSVLDDGTYYFDTPTPLVPQDVNGKRDVYEWKAGHAQLLSPGTQIKEVSFRDASADGADVYVLTASRLVPQDKDGNRDAYDVRRGGGIASQNVASSNPNCSGEACQPASPQGGAPPGVGSAGFRAAAENRALRVATPRPTSNPVAHLKVGVPGKGRIEAFGPGLVKAKKAVAGPGNYTVSVRLTPKKKKRLNDGQKMRIKVTVRFVPAVGAVQSTKVMVNFEPKNTKKGGR